jgi:hypothetical protein
LFLPDQYYDHRIWADLPASLGDQVVLYDQYEPMPWAEAANPAFPDAVRRLAPDHSFDVVAGAGEAARLAFRAALLGLAKAIVFFQPSPDRYLDDVAENLPTSDLISAAGWFSSVLDALHETDSARRRSLVIQAWRDRYGPHLAAGDLELALKVIGDHAEELLAMSKQVAALAEAGAGVPWPEESWVDRLGEIDVPVAVVVSRPAARIGAVIARQARDGQTITAAADTNLVWLEDRVTAVAAIRQMLSS